MISNLNTLRASKTMLYIYSIYGLVAQWTRARSYDSTVSGFESFLPNTRIILIRIDIYIQFPIIY